MTAKTGILQEGYVPDRPIRFFERQTVLGIGVDILNVPDAVQAILSLVQRNRSGYVCAANVHMCMEAVDNPGYAGIINRADIVVPDGRPLYWAQQLLGHKNGAHIRGQDLMMSLCAAAENHGISIGLYGAADMPSLEKVAECLRLRYPDLRISYMFSPPFRSLTVSESEAICANIRRANIGLLFVGIGCPKQEQWMARHAPQIHCVSVGVGAAMDFVTGRRRAAPRLLQNAGLEWLYRLAAEPKRLWRRYLIHNPRFLYHFIRQLLGASPSINGHRDVI